MNAHLEKLIVQNGIEDLIARFDDAVIRYDREAFRDLWAPDGIWEISSPVPMRVQGHDAISAMLGKFHELNQFFFRSTSRPVIHAADGHATFRSPTIELARRDGGIGYANTALYYDEADFDGERWRFSRRFYQYLWVDLKSPLGGETVGLSTRERGGSAPRLESGVPA